MDVSQAANSAAVFDFVDGYLDDLERGSVRPLAEYLARFPGHEASIAREYLRLRDRHRGPSHERPDRQEDRRVGPYRLIEEIGRGGQGTVFLAEDVRIARRVALKLLPGGIVSQERRARLRREAEAISRLHHAGICAIHEAEIDADVPYIAMQYVDGEPMAAALAAAREGRPTRVPYKPADRKALCTVLALFERVARALHAAHEAGVIHRDVKPGNVLVTPEGTPVVLDFGLASDERAAGGITRPGEQFGTPAFMSPEQLRGSGADLDRTTDVYSLGVTLFEALTLAKPFEAASRLELERAILEAPVPLATALNPRLPDELRVVLETAMEKDRARRYPTALDLAEDLRRLREYEPILARPAGAGLRFRRWVRRQPVLATALLGTLLLLSIGLSLSLWAVAREGRALRFALGRHLAERSSKLLAEDHAAALALGIEAVELAPNYLTRAALFSALEACALERVLESQPNSLFHDLALSPDGSAVAAGFADGHARVWSLDDGRLLADLEAGRGAVRRLSFDRSGRRLALGTEQGVVLVFEPDTARVSTRLDLEQGPILWVEFAPQGGRLVALPAHGRACVLDLQTEALIELDTLSLQAGCARFSPDGERILTASLGYRGEPATASTRAHLWDASSGARLATLAGHTAAIQSCEFDPGGRLVATGSLDASARLWDARTGAPLGAPLQHEGPVACVAFDASGTHLATTTDAGLASVGRVWSLEDGGCVRLEGHDASAVVHAAFSPDGTRVVTSSFDLTVRVWDAATGESERVLRALIQPLRTCWSPDGLRLVTLSMGPWAHVWRTSPFPDSYRLVGHRGPITWVGFDPTAERVLTASEDGSLRLWRTPPQGRLGECGALIEVLEGHSGPVRGAAFVQGGAVVSWSDDGTLRRWGPPELGEPTTALQLGAPLVFGTPSPDGTRLLVVGRGGEAWLAGLADRAEAMRLSGMAARRACFSPDGEWFAVAGVEDAIEVRDARTGELVRRLPFAPAGLAGKRGAWDVAVHPSGRELAIACAGIHVRFLDPLTGERGRPDFALFEPKRLAYAPDGDHLLVWGHTGGGSIRVQDAGEGGFVRPEIFHTGHITDAAFSGDGAWVLSGSRDATAYVWNARTGQPFAHLTGHGEPLTSVALSPVTGDRRLVLGGRDGSATVWPVDPLPAALARRPRELEPWEVKRERRLAVPLRYR